MDFRPQHAQPFTYAQVRELEIPTITKEIARLENSLFHLNRTQVELNAHLTGSPQEDREILEVIRENEGVIASQNERISMLKLALEEQGINTKSGHYDAADPAGRQGPGASPQTQNTPTASQGNNTQREGIGEEEGGMYL